MLAIVLGSSALALEEFRAAQSFLDERGREPHVVCVNDAIRFCPVKPAAFCTVQGGNIPLFLTPDIDLDGVRIFTRRRVHGVASTVVKTKWFGTSGLYAVQIALDELKADGVILAGVPIDANAGTLAPEHSLMSDAIRVAGYRPEWILALPEIKDRVRSMSGWTRDLLGAPDADWLDRLNPPRDVARDTAPMEHAI